MKKTIEGIQIRALLSRNLKRIRTNAGLSQTSLAERASLAPNHINAIENGKRWVSSETIAKLSIALKAEPYQFFLSDSRWRNQATEMFSLFLDDFESNHSKLMSEYRGRFLNRGSGDSDDNSTLRRSGQEEP